MQNYYKIIANYRTISNVSSSKTNENVEESTCQREAMRNANFRELGFNNKEGKEPEGK